MGKCVRFTTREMQPIEIGTLIISLDPRQVEDSATETDSITPQIYKKVKKFKK